MSEQQLQAKLLDHEELSWDRLVEVTNAEGKTTWVRVHWDNHDGFSIDNWYELPEWLINSYEDSHAMAQDLDEKTYTSAYNVKEMSA